MAISVVCEDCFYPFNAPEKAQGRAVKCPECGSVVRVPKPDVAEAVAVESAPLSQKRSPRKAPSPKPATEQAPPKARPVFRVGVLIAVVAALGVGGLGITWFARQRARQQSIQELSSADDAQRLQAVSELGDGALPVLVDRLNDPDPNVRRQALQLLRGLGSKAESARDDIARLAKDPEIDVRKEVAATLAAVVTDPNARVDQLATLFALNDEAISRDAISLLQNIPGERASSLLLDAVRSDKVPLQQTAVAILAGRTLPSAEAVTVLQAAEKNAQDETLKQAIGETLRHWGVLTDQELLRVVQVLTGDRPSERKQMSAAILNPAVGLGIEGAQQDIRQIREATDQAVQDRIAACQTLASCTPKTPAGLKALHWALITDVPEVKIAAADALSSFGDLAAATVPTLAEERRVSHVTISNQLLADRARTPKVTQYTLNAAGEVIGVNGGRVPDQKALDDWERERNMREWKEKGQPLLEKLNASLDEALRRSDPTKKLQGICGLMTGKDATEETRLQAIDEISRLPSAQRLAFLDLLLAIYFDYYSHPTSEQLRQNYRKRCQTVFNAADSTLMDDLRKQLQSGDKTDRALAAMMIDVLERQNDVPIDAVVGLFKESLKSSPTDGYAVDYLHNRFNLDPAPRIVGWLNGRSEDIRPAVPLLATIVASPRRADLLVRRDAWLLLARTDKAAAIRSAAPLLESATEAGAKRDSSANTVLNDMLEPIASFGTEAKDLSPALERIAGTDLEQQVKLLTTSALVSADPQPIIQRLYILSLRPTGAPGAAGKSLPVFLQAFNRIGRPAAGWLVKAVQKREYESGSVSHAMTILAKMDPEHVAPFTMDLVGEVNRKGGLQNTLLNTEQLLATVTRLPNLPADALDTLTKGTVEVYNSHIVQFAHGSSGKERRKFKRNEFAPKDDAKDNSAFVPFLPAAISGLADTIRAHEKRELIVRGLADQAKSKSQGALLILAAVGKDAPEAVAALSQIAVSDGESPERWLAIYALGRIGPDAKESVPKLVSILKSEESFRTYHQIALQSLLEISAEDAVAVLTSLLRRPSRSSYPEQVRNSAIAIAPGLRPFADTLVPLLAADIRNDKLSTTAQIASARLLRHIDPPHAVDVLAAEFASNLKTLRQKKGKDIFPITAYEQISLLVECGQEGANSAPHLLQIATDQTPFSLVWARQEIGDAIEIETVKTDYPELYEAMQERSADINERMTHDLAVRDCRVTAWRALAMLPPDNTASFTE